MSIVRPNIHDVLFEADRQRDEHDQKEEEAAIKPKISEEKNAKIYSSDEGCSDSSDSDDDDGSHISDENEEENLDCSDNEDYAYVPLECAFCRKKLFGDHQIARNVFLQECEAKKFNILDPQLFQFVSCRLCSFLFPGADGDIVSEHVRAVHGERVKLRGVEESGSTIEQITIQPSTIKKICDNYRTGKLKRITKGDHGVGCQWWLQKKIQFRHVESEKTPIQITVLKIYPKHKKQLIR